MNFELIIIATATVLLCTASYGYARSKDPFHPAIYMAAMLSFLYVFMPLYIEITQADELRRFLTDSQVEFVQLLNLAGVFAFCTGILVGSYDRAWHPSDPTSLPTRAKWRLELIGRALAILSNIGFVYGILNVGGLEVAYGRAYGGGWADSGYARELIFFGLPGCLLMLVAWQGRSLRFSNVFWIFFALSPIILHGILGARRGPTFMALTALGAGLCVDGRIRPRMFLVTFGGVVLGILLLWLLANRGQIHLGTDFDEPSGVTQSYVFKAGPANEFVYAAGSILDAIEREQFFWGRRYLVQFLVRPIPRAIWPDKYLDSSERLGIPDVEQNSGTGGKRFRTTLGWAGPNGASPGMVADAWLEFWWFCLPILACYGFLFGWLWHRARTVGGLCTATYCLATSLSIYIVMQTFSAFAFRFILLGSPILVACVFVKSRTDKRAGGRALIRGFQARFQAEAAGRAADRWAKLHLLFPGTVRRNNTNSRKF